MYVSSYACGVYNADLCFQDTAMEGYKQNSIKAQHLIQAFKPGEITPEFAHKVGYQFAMEVTEGKYEFVLATHCDKDHVHNHILFNHISFVDHKAYRGNIRCQKEIAKINDKICASHGLSVIDSKEKPGKAYYDYKDLKTNNSHRQVLKNTIDACVPLVTSFDELLEMLKKMGYEIKITNKNYSFRKDDEERFVRLKNLGERYTYDALLLRIAKKDINAAPYFAPPKADIGLLVDLSGRLESIKSPAYANKVALSDVKRIAATYAFLNEHNLFSVSKIKEAQSAWALTIKEKRASIKSLENEIDSCSNILEALEKKEKYNDVYADYLRSGKSKEFFEKHNMELMFFDSACKTLGTNKIPKNATAADYKKKLDELTAKKDALLASYHEDVSNLKQLDICAKNIDIILSEREVHNKKIKGKKKDKDI